MLFHIGILGYLALQTPSRLRQLVYAILAAIFFFVLIQTGTRGTAIGFVVGSLVSVGYVALFGFRRPHLRQYAIGGCLAILVLVGGFWLVKDTAPVQENPTLARIANIDLKKDLEVRRIIWGMAFEGVKERPVLGWGSGNFNYVFNKQYDSRLYGQEQWFDRVHNIVLDWLIYGGVIGFLAYVSVFISVFYYLVYRPWRYNDQTFSVLEQALLVGLLIGYTLHNMVVFDNLISYIFFATIIAFIHYKVASPIAKIQDYKVSPIIVQQIIFPIIFVVVLAVVYIVNVPAILSAQDIIIALTTKEPSDRYLYLDAALTRGSFAQQEIVEQFVQQAIVVARTTTVTEEVRALYLARAEQEIQRQITVKPGDARLHVFAANFYRSTGQSEKAIAELSMARKLSPNKQWIILQQGAAALGQEQNEVARDYFKEAFLLDESFADAREYYVASLFLTGDGATAHTLIEEAGEEFFDRIAQSDFVANAVNISGDKEFVIKLFERRVELDNSVAQNWANLAYLYYEIKDNEKAIETLKRGASSVPSFKKSADCIESNINARRALETPCT
jgi:tetratricopeptide (TPR) repeat protein